MTTSTGDGPESPTADAAGAARRARLLPAARLAGQFVWRAARRTFLLSLLAEVGVAIALAGVLVFGGRLVGELTGPDPVRQLSDVLPETLGMGVALVASGIAQVVVRQTRWLVGEEVTRRVQEEIVEVATTVDYEVFEEQEFHDHLDRANDEAPESSYELVYALLNLANVAATSAVVVLVLVRTVPEVLGALVLIAVPSVLAARASARLAFATSYELTPNDRLRGYLYRALTNKAEAREVRVFGLAGVLDARWGRLYDERLAKIRSLVRKQVLFNGLAALIGALLVAGVLLVLVQAAVDGRITLAEASVAIVALQQLNARLRTAATASGSVRQSVFFLDDFERFRAYRTRGAAATPDPGPTDAATEGVPSSATDPVPSGLGRLTVEHVSFRYPGTDRLVLHDVSLTVEPGEIVALVGVSGSGKTTLSQLVAGLYRPTSGRISFDGVDIASMPREVWWRQVAVVFQDFVRYELTAHENIAMSDHRRMEDRAASTAAAERAGIHAALDRLPKRYDTLMSRGYESGADLSVGQWQRVAVARAFFREAPLLVLDEPASALDAVAEQALFDRLVELCDSRSVLLVSHRFSTVRLAHRICVVHEGRIVEEGTHDQLLARGGRYASLFDLQAKGYLPDPPAATSVHRGAGS